MLVFRIGFLEFHFVDFIDTLLVSILLFKLYKLIKDSIALRIFIGFLLIYLAYLFVKATEMKLLTEILGQFMGLGVMTVIILFQQEFRKFLVLIGKGADFNNSFIARMFKSSSAVPKEDLVIMPVIEAIKTLSQEKVGALIVFSHYEAEVKEYIDTGDLLQAQVSKLLLVTIFAKNTPLHDGAVIICKDKIVAAKCILPVSDNQDIPAHLGLRHRAAIGVTEAVDVGVLIVSEETGNVSFARRGSIYTQLSLIDARRLLLAYLTGKERDDIDAKPFLTTSLTTTTKVFN